MAGLLSLASPKPVSRLVSADLVSATVRCWAQSSFKWGESDCLLSVVRYVAQAAGQPMPSWPRYSTGPAALRILRRHGGLEGYAAMVLEQLGCARTHYPVRGDVGLLNIPGTGPTASLCLGEKWAARGQHGVVMIAAEPEISWAVPMQIHAETGSEPCRS